MKRLTPEQRDLLIKMMAAGYRDKSIINEFNRQFGESIVESTISHYRSKFDLLITKQKEERYANALDSGLADRAEQIVRLHQLAESLEDAVNTDKRNKIAYIREYRATLDQIAELMNWKKMQVEHTGKVILEWDIPTPG